MSSITKEQKNTALGKLLGLVELDGNLCLSREKLTEEQRKAITEMLGDEWHLAGYEEVVKLIGQDTKVATMALDSEQRIATGERGISEAFGGPCAIIPRSGELVPLPLIKAKYKTGWINISEADRKDILERLELIDSKLIAWVTPGKGDIVIGFGNYSKDLLHIDATGRDEVAKYAGAVWIRDAAEENSEMQEITRELIRKAELEITNLETYGNTARMENLKTLIRLESQKLDESEKKDSSADE